MKDCIPNSIENSGEAKEMIKREEKQAGEVGAEITPAMELAGLEAFSAFDTAHDLATDIIKEVYQAMVRARPVSQ